MNEKIFEDLKKGVDCLIILNCLKDSPEKERLKVAVNCLGLRETARLLGKDPGNLYRTINGNKKSKPNKVRIIEDEPKK